MSSLIIKVVKIADVKPHPDPETISLETVIIGGWQCVVKKNSFKTGDLAIYFPLDSLLPEKLSDMIRVTKYLSKGRVKAAKLRGEPSYGLLWPVSAAKEALQKITHNEYLPKFEEGEDVADFLGITKWEPPLKLNAADQETPHPLFFEYTDIENYRNFPDILQEGEEVVITEKIHGCNSRHAYIENEFMAGSHSARLKENKDNQHWYLFSEDMKDLLVELSKESNQSVIMYGEIFGSKVQDLHYGYVNGQRAHSAFDIRIGMKYLDYEVFTTKCLTKSIPIVPELYRGPFSLDKILQFSNSMSTYPGADCIMEGVVIRPVKERNDPRIGRVILKYVFDQYYNRRGKKTEDR